MKVIRTFEKKLLKNGWPKQVEIKAAHIFRTRFMKNIPSTYKYKNNPTPLLREVLTKLSNCDIEVDYISVKKEKLSDSLKAAPFGIVYNYLAGQLLSARFKSSAKVHLIVDAQNKEVHSGKHFDGYIETKAFESSPNIRLLQIEHLDSHRDRRLRAVDYFAWAVFRKYEHNDERFYNVIRGKLNINNCKAWFY